MVNVGRRPLAVHMGLELPETIEEEREMWTYVNWFVLAPDDKEYADTLDRYRAAPRHEGGPSDRASVPVSSPHQHPTRPHTSRCPRPPEVGAEENRARHRHRTCWAGLHREAPDQRWVADITEFACWDGPCSWPASKTSAINQSWAGRWG